jgi:hypothetical protein
MGAKNRLIIDGKMRILNKDEKVAEVKVPSADALEDWKKQSI